MKRKLSKILCALICAALVITAVPFTASAKITGIYVSAEDINYWGTYVIQDALDLARERANESDIFKVTVEPGSYTLSYGLKIYDNTCLSLYGVTLTRGAYCYNMLRTGDDDAYDSGVEGYHYRNITLEGGTFDGNNAQNTMLKIAHAKNFVMKNVTMQNNLNNHIMEVAGVDGFTASGCNFSNQIVNSGTCYEALQFDILKSGNLIGCRSEDLPMKNVLVENCTFTNCPRGLGSHTAVHNNPHNTLIIRNNTFKNMGSAAVQTLGWINSSITGNTIDTAPRAIAVYSIADGGSGTILPSEFAKEGNTTQHVSDEYKAQKSNILVANNYIVNCGTVDDKYAGYEKAAISVMGAKITSTGSGKLPVGEYPSDTVTVKNNLIYVKGSGIRVEHSKTISVDSNVIFCTPANTSANYYGIVFRDGVNPGNITKNYISNPEVNGIQIDSCLVNYITGNEIYNAGKYGMGTYASTLGLISNNDIRTAKAEGISILNASSVNTKIAENRVSGAPSGIHIMSNASAKLIEKNLTYNCTSNIDYTKSSGLVTVGTNYTANAAVTTFSVDATTVNLNIGECFRIGKTVTPVNAITNFSFTNSNPAAAIVDSTGRITAKSAGTTKITVKSANGKALIVTVNVAAPAANILGDVDGDGYVTLLDSAMLGGYTSKAGEYDGINLSNADVTGDGKVTAADRIVLTRYTEKLSGFTTLPKAVSRSAEVCSVSIGSASAGAGEYVELGVFLDNNPGIATADLNIEYDTSALELVEVEDSGLLQNTYAVHADNFGSPYRLSWENDLAGSNETQTGKLATLRFKVSDTAQEGYYTVSVNQSTAEVYDCNVGKASVQITNGTVEVKKPAGLIGDVDRSGVVDIDDATLIQRHAAKYTDGEAPLIDESDELMMTIADVNSDGIISVGDATMVQQYIAGIIGSLGEVETKPGFTPEQYETELITEPR